MIKILGAGDIFATILLLATAGNFYIPREMMFGALACLFLKAVCFLPDIGSILDIVVVFLLIASIFITIPSSILFIFAALLGLKGIMSLLA